MVESYGGVGIAIRSKPVLRVCQDCNYMTFAHYVSCPRCNSEKWRNQVEG